MKPPGVPSGVTAERVREVVDFREAGFRVVDFRVADFRVPGFRLGDFLARVALVALDFLVVTAFFAPADRLADLAFLVAADFLAAVERLADLAFLVAADFFAAVERLADGRFRLGDFLARAALVALDFLVAAPFLAAVERLADLAFLVRAAFFAAVERLADVDFLDDFFAGAMLASFSRRDQLPLVIAIRTLLKLADRIQRLLPGAIVGEERFSWLRPGSSRAAVLAGKS